MPSEKEETAGPGEFAIDRVQFDYGVQPSQLVTLDYGVDGSKEVLRTYTGQVGEPKRIVFEIPESRIVFMRNFAGFSVSVTSNHVVPLTPNTAVAVAGPSTFISLVGRGLQSRVGFATNKSSIQGLVNWAERTGRLTSERPFHLVKFAPESFSPAMMFALQDGEPDYSAYYSMATTILSNSSPESFFGGEVSEPGETKFKALLRAVVEDLQKDWSLKSASAFCGYSMYHFSRTFREEQKLGFPEFVQKLRAKKALSLVLSGTHSIHAIARLSGLEKPEKVERLVFDSTGLSTTELQSFIKGSVRV